LVIVRLPDATGAAWIATEAAKSIVFATPPPL
jgi:hypothetical protein